MKKINTLEAFWIFIILLGLIGSLYILGEWTGYIISDESNYAENKTLDIQEIKEIVVREGSRKRISFNVKNIGDIVLNNCRLTGKESIGSWIYSDQVKRLEPGEKEYFIFYLNVPDKVKPGDYRGEFEIDCDEKKILHEFNVSILEDLRIIKIIEIKQKRNILNISYVFNNQGLIGDSVVIEIWVMNQGNEIKRMQDIFPINVDSLIERNVLIELPKDSIGNHDIYFALSSDLNNYIKKSILIRESSLTGNVVFEFKEGKGIYFVIFVIIIFLGIFFIIKNHTKEIHKTLADKSPSKLVNLK